MTGIPRQVEEDSMNAWRYSDWGIFRRRRYGEWADVGDGVFQLIFECGSLEAGRWEGFISLSDHFFTSDDEFVRIDG